MCDNARTFSALRILFYSMKRSVESFSSSPVDSTAVRNDKFLNGYEHGDGRLYVSRGYKTFYRGFKRASREYRYNLWKLV